MPIHTLPANRETILRVAAVPISFEVRSRLRVDLIDGGLGGLRLVEEPVDPPYWKNFDEDEPPTRWLDQFDTRSWAILLAESDSGQTLGAATLVYDTPAVNMLEGRRDLTVLWDLRVQPEARRQGVGAQLFRAAEDWSRARGARQMKIESQNNNVSACRFYAAQGAVLGALNRYAYYHTPFTDETQLLWYKDL